MDIIAFSFNPLHCGAVVASRHVISEEPALGGFQSPSLRGSGRFTPARPRSTTTCAGFNPLHCGAVVASAETIAAGIGI